MSGPRVRVLVVDDSAFARKVIRTVLEADPRIEVVGIARDGLDALEKIAELKPDVVTLDLVMPELDGVGVLLALKDHTIRPQVVVVSTSDSESELGVAALVAGAFGVVHKPTALATARLYELGDQLVETVMIAAASARSVPPLRPPSIPAKPVTKTLVTTRRLLVIGASTGGPRAVTQLLHDLPATFPIPIAVVVHMPAGYTEAFANRLDKDLPFHVVEARPGIILVPGTVVIARAGIHLKVRRDGPRLVVALDVEPSTAVHRPSVDALLGSAATELGRDLLAVVLTGMGSDGLEGAGLVRARGGHMFVEDESSCVVYGMPRSIQEAGLADEKVPLLQMASAVVAKL
ncbi:MAG: Chemotaxis response regulator protein-glutamate methylesterase CheB [Labilithrix sp.]|nr:Chemotaxis response regulator protein-glutamate methylesterase CheB [Labilithrix sp.]